MCGKLFKNVERTKCSAVKNATFQQRKQKKNINIALVNISVLGKIHLEI